MLKPSQMNDAELLDLAGELISGVLSTNYLYNPDRLLLAKDCINSLKNKSLSTSVVIGLNRYVNHHISPGGFLRAVLENNLHEAISSADNGNLRRLPEIVKYIWNELPADCWGSEEAVAKWIENRKD